MKDVIGTVCLLLATGLALVFIIAELTTLSLFSKVSLVLVFYIIGAWGITTK